MQHARSNLGLDVVRAAAIYAVLFSHSYEWWIGASRGSELIAGYVGGAGVEVFFSLSGFLIGGILLRTAAAGLGRADLVRFWSRRWLRTLPAYWVTILLLDWHFGHWDWYTPFFLQSFVPREVWPPLSIHTWSLVLEEWFYLLVPPMFALALILGRRSRWAIPTVCAGLIVGSALARAWVQVHPAAFWGPEPGNNPLLRLDCAAWGVLAACWVRYGGALRRWAAWPLLAVGLGGLAVLFWLFIESFTPDRLAPFGYVHWVNAYLSTRPSLTELFAAGVVLAAQALLPAGRGILAWLVGVSARLSYALYLVHVPVLYLMRAAGFDDATSWRARVLMALGVLGAAVLMRGLVELPVLALRDRLAPEPGPRPLPRPLLPAWTLPIRSRATAVLTVLGNRLGGRRTALGLGLCVGLATLVLFAVRAWVGLVTLEFGDETEKYVAAAMLRQGGRLYRDVFANHGPLAYALAWLGTFVTGTHDFTRTRLIVVAFALLAALAIAASPVFRDRRPVFRLWAAALFLAPVSAFWFVHPLNMLIYHALGGYMLTVVLAQLTLPALVGRTIRLGNAIPAGAAITLAVAAAYPFAVPALLFLVAAGLGMIRRGSRRMIGTAGLGLLGGAAAAGIPVAAWITVKADWVGLYVYHFYFNQVVYGRMTEFALTDSLAALNLSFGIPGRLHAFAILAGLFGLFGVGRSCRPLGLRSVAAIAATAAGLLMLNPKGSDAFPDTAQVIACLAVAAIMLARHLSVNHGARHAIGLATAGLLLIGAEQTARTALISPHGIPRAEAPAVLLRPDPNGPFANIVDAAVPAGGTFLGLPFMAAIYIFADRQPASGAFYYLPFQAEYDKAPVLGRTIDLCADIRRVQPRIILVMDLPIPVWGTILQYKPCVAEVLAERYTRSVTDPAVYRLLEGPSR